MIKCGSKFLEALLGNCVVTYQWQKKSSLYQAKQDAIKIDKGKQSNFSFQKLDFLMPNSKIKFN